MLMIGITGMKLPGRTAVSFAALLIAARMAGLPATAAVMSGSPAAHPAVQIGTPACGDLEFPTAATGSWVILGGGVNVNSNGSADEGTDGDCASGQSMVNGVPAGEEWQCPEFINRLYLTKGWISGTWSGDAGQPMWNDAPASLSKQANGSVSYLGPGDVVLINVYMNGSFYGGHALVVNDSSDVSSGTVSLVSQNSGYLASSEPVVQGTITGGSVTVGGGSSTWSYSTIGVVHAPAAAAAPPVPPVVIPADVNKDHKDDLIEITPREGTGFNVVPLLSTGKKFAYGGLWFADTQHALADTKFVTGDFTGNGRDDLAVITPRSGTGFNIVVLLAAKSGFQYDNVWYADTQHDLSDTDFVAGRFTKDGRDDIAEITPRQGTGFNIVPLMSTGKKFAYGGPWFADTQHDLASTVFVPGQFTKDGRTDIAEITPRQGTGFNIVPLMSTGKKFAYGGPWFADTQHDLASTAFVPGHFTRDGRDDIAEITPRGAVGLNIVPLMSTGKKFAYGNLWWPDMNATIPTTDFVPGQFTRNGRDDIAEITPRGAVGLNIVPLMSTGGKFAYGGLWFKDTSATISSARFL